MPRFLISALTWLCLTGVSVVYGQDAYLELYGRYAQPRIFVDALTLPADSAAVTLFTVRVPNSLLVFLREGEGDAGVFVSRLEATVQVRSGERLVAERTWQATHVVDAYETSASRLHDFQAQIPLALRPGTYVYRLRIRDLNAGDDAYVSAARLLDVPDYARRAVGDPIASVLEVPARRFTPANLGGHVPWSGNGVMLVPISAGQGPLRYSVWEMPAETRPNKQRISRSGRDDEWEWPEETEPIDLTNARRVLEGSVPESTWLPLGPTRVALEPGRLRPFVVSRTPERGWLVPISVDSIGVRGGDFALEVELDGPAGPVRRVTPFRFHWKDLPIALHDAETAIRLLSWIETPERIRAMLDGSREERERVLTEYWADRDPTPGSAYNELMAEYYRRIDHAALAFRTGGGTLPNGLQTDQARIYIVHGPPARVERAFPPAGGVEETWTYDDGRRFVFWALSSLEPLALKNR